MHTIHRIGILCYMYTVHGTDNIRILCTMYCVVFPLSSWLFLKAHNHGGDILLLLSDWMTTRYMLQPLEDAQTSTPTGHMMMIPSWLTLLSWSLVSRTVQCTQCFWQRLVKKGVGGGGSSKHFRSSWTMLIIQMWHPCLIGIFLISHNSNIVIIKQIHIGHHMSQYPEDNAS